MSQRSKIEWTTHTWNPLGGCTRISPGCMNCYAETESPRRQAQFLGTGKKSAKRWKKSAQLDALPLHVQQNISKLGA